LAASTDNVGVTGYRVERCQGTDCSDFAEIGTTTTADFSSTGLQANTNYRFRVRAVDAAENMSPYSAIATRRTPAPDTTRATAPTGLAGSQRAAALKRCKRKHGKARKKCNRRAKRRPT
jgi:chitodextrinase